MQTNRLLAKWIDENSSRLDFARKVEIGKSHLSLILQGKRGMSFDVATRIERVTKGAFTAARLMSDQKSLMGATQ